MRQSLKDVVARVAIALSAATAMGRAEDARTSPADRRLLARPIMRCEANQVARWAARKEQQDAAFARIKALPAAPAAPPLRRRAVNMNWQFIAWRELEEPEGEDDPDENPNRPKRRRVVILEETFDQVVFGSTGDSESGRAYLEKMLSRKIADVEQVRRPTPLQQKRLQLAGRGDIKRLLDRIEDERKAFQCVRDDLEPAPSSSASSVPSRSPSARALSSSTRSTPRR